MVIHLEVFLEAIKREEFGISCYMILRGSFCVKLVLSMLFFFCFKAIFFPLQMS